MSTRSGSRYGQSPAAARARGNRRGRQTRLFSRPVKKARQTKSTMKKLRKGARFSDREIKSIQNEPIRQSVLIAHPPVKWSVQKRFTEDDAYGAYQAGTFGTVPGTDAPTPYTSDLSTGNPNQLPLLAYEDLVDWQAMDWFSATHQVTGEKAPDPLDGSTAPGLANWFTGKTEGHVVPEDYLGPSNSLIVIPGLHALSGTAGQVLRQGTGEHEVVGRWITPTFPTSIKFEVDYKYLKPGIGMSLEVLQGWICTTGDKGNCRPITAKTWKNDIKAIALEELMESGIDADYLSYRETSRTIKIIKKFTIKPPDNAVQLHQTKAANAASTAVLAGKSKFTLRFPWGNRKTKLTQLEATAGTGESLHHMVPNDLWIPFVLFKAPDLTSVNQGFYSISHSSKTWFSDN